MNNTISTSRKAYDKIVGTIQFFQFPIGIKGIFYSVLPIMFIQALQRIYPIIDNHFITVLGTQALLIHNIQYSFISLGQYIGAATATSYLIFWRRDENSDKQRSIFIIQFGLCFLVTLFCVLFATLYTKEILNHFSVQKEYYHLATVYFHLGLINMLFQAIYLALIGVIIAEKMEKLSLFFSIILLSLNFLVDYVAIHFIFSGMISPSHIFPAMMVIVMSTLLMLLFAVIILIYIVLKRTNGWHLPNIRQVFKIWSNELGGAFISGIYPIIYIFQLGAVKASGSILITYQLLLQLTSVFCIPLLSIMQIALRDASAVDGKNTDQQKAPRWWQKLFYFGLVPTQLLLIVFTVVPVFFISKVFGYIVPSEQVIFVQLFLIASIIGQFGNALTVPIRARKKSHLVTTSYFIADVIIMLGGMQLIIFLGHANPVNTGLVTLTYATVYLFINAYFSFRK